MKMAILEARIQRSKLNALAEDLYRDFESKLIQNLRKQGKSALLGIEKENGTYTVIGENSVYYLTESKLEGEMSFNKFQDLFKRRVLQRGKIISIEYLFDGNNNMIWVKDSEVLSALSNIILLLSKNKVIIE